MVALHGKRVVPENSSMPVPTPQNVWLEPTQNSSGEVDIELGAHNGGGGVSEEPARQVSPDAALPCRVLSGSEKDDRADECVAPLLHAPTHLSQHVSTRERPRRLFTMHRQDSKVRESEEHQAVIQAQKHGIKIDPTWLQSLSLRDLQTVKNLCVSNGRAIDVLLQLHRNRSYEPLRELRDYLTLQACDMLARYASPNDQEGMYAGAFVLFEIRMRLSDEGVGEGDSIVSKLAERAKDTLATPQQESQRGGGREEKHAAAAVATNVPSLPTPTDAHGETQQRRHADENRPGRVARGARDDSVAAGSPNPEHEP